MSMASLFMKVQHRIDDLIRHPDVSRVAGEMVEAQDFTALEGHKYGLLVTYRKSGEPVSKPVWVGVADGKAYVRSEENAGKIKRIRNNPSVLVAPCNIRGKPLGPAASGVARVLPSAENDRGEDALRANHGLERRAFEGAGSLAGVKVVYLEITPAGKATSAGQEEAK